MASVVALLAVATKIFVVSHGAPTTIAALANTQGLTGLITVLIAVGAPSIASGAFAASVIGLAEAVREEEPVGGPLLGLLLGLVLWFLLIPMNFAWVLLAGAVAMIGTSWVFRALRHLVVRRGMKLPHFLQSGSELVRLSPLGFVALPLIVGLFGLTVSDSMWLPREQLSLFNGVKAEGYVLSEDGDFITVMTVQPRRIERLVSSEILSRGFCEVDQNDQRSILATLVWPEAPEYPPCPAA